MGLRTLMKAATFLSVLALVTVSLAVSASALVTRKDRTFKCEPGAETTIKVGSWEGKEFTVFNDECICDEDEYIVRAKAAAELDTMIEDPSRLDRDPYDVDRRGGPDHEVSSTETTTLYCIKIDDLKALARELRVLEGK